MDELKKILDSMKKSSLRWNAEIVDDPEEMFDEYPKFLLWAIPLLEKYILENEKTN